MIKPILPIVLTAAFVAGCSEEAGQDQVLRLQPDDKTIVGNGRRLYAEHCASCHGANLEGQNQWRVRDAEGFLPAPPHDQTGHTWHHSDEHLFELTKNGLASFAGKNYKSRMPKYKDVLSDQEIRAVLSFIKAQWPQSIRKRHDQLNEAALADKAK